MPRAEGFWGKTIGHAARYRAPYVLMAVWLVMVLVAPTAPVRQPETTSQYSLPPIAGGEKPTADTSSPSGIAAPESDAPGTSRTGATGTPAPAPASGPGTPPAGGIAAPSGASTGTFGGGSPPPHRSAAGDSAGPVATRPSAAVPGGTTRGGVDCRAGVRQFESAYAAPCRPQWTGPNGGTTNRGVTADAVKIVVRRYGETPDNVFLEQAVAQGGFAPEKVTAPVRQVFADYFNRTYELYGRRVVLEDYTTNASMLKEGVGEGREMACADAAAIAEERRAFGVLPALGVFGPGGGGLGAFSDCAVERRLFLPVGVALYPETWFRRSHPYAWGIQPDCERIARLYAEYVAKRLAGMPARHARDPLYAASPRVFGLMGVTGGFRPCVDLFEAELKGRYGVRIASRYDYGAGAANDPSVIPRQAAQAVLQFKAAGVTSLILIADFFTTANLTSQARSQQWGPEWIIQGVGNIDNDGFARLFDQDRVNGHLFGMSFIGSPSGYAGPESEPARLYRKLTGKPLPAGTDGDYYSLVHMFNLLQSAGPTLTPEAIASGVGTLTPSGAPRFDFGGWNFHTGPDGARELDHTGIDDAREVYWDGDANGPDGKKGTFVATYGGRRFTNGQWPGGEPPVYPKGCSGTCKRTAGPEAFLAGLVPLAFCRRGRRRIR